MGDRNRTLDTYRLYMQDGKTLVAVAEIPHYNPPPDVINYGTRAFVRHIDSNYYEAKVAWAPVPKVAGA